MIHATLLPDGFLEDLDPLGPTVSSKLSKAATVQPCLSMPLVQPQAKTKRVTSSFREDDETSLSKLIFYE